MAFPQGQGVPTAMGVTPARPSNTGMSAGPSGMNVPPSPPSGGGPAAMPPGPVPGMPMSQPPPMTGAAAQVPEVYDLDADPMGLVQQIAASGLQGDALMNALVQTLSGMGVQAVAIGGQVMPLGGGAPQMAGPPGPPVPPQGMAPPPGPRLV